MSNITIIIHTRNEENNIQDCIDSAKLLTDQIINVDMESTDSTSAIAKKHNVAVVLFPFSFYVEPARDFGIKQAKTDWVFILDVDERMTKALAQEINDIITNYELRNKNYEKQKAQQRLNTNIQTTNYELPITHYYVPRKNIFGKNKWLKHGGWWPDYQIRLIYKPAFVSWPKQIHSTPITKGVQGKLKNPIIHYFHGNLELMVNKTILFENIESDLLYKANKKTGTLIFFRKFVGELFRRLIKEVGFLDGTIGIIESIYQAYSKTITYIFLYEKQKTPADKKKSGII